MTGSWLRVYFFAVFLSLLASICGDLAYGQTVRCIIPPGNTIRVVLSEQSTDTKTIDSNRTKASGKSRPESPYKKYLEGAMNAFDRQNYNLARKLIQEFERLGKPFDADVDSSCSQEQEYSLLREALKCAARKQPAQRYWADFNKAKNEVLTYFKKEVGKELIPYISCSAYDLTQYESLCWNDHTVSADAFDHFLAELKQEPRLYSPASWKRTKKERLQPQWIDEWVLHPEGLRPVNPCEIGERGIIALGKHKDGKIYISGYAASCMIRWIIIEAYQLP